SHKEVTQKSFGSGENQGPHYQFNIGNEEVFVNQLSQAQEGVVPAERLVLEYDNTKNWTGDVIGWLVPIALMIALWLFIMRRMSGGGGPAGQIFNFGKSRATLFDQDTNVNITFQDVAGLDSAKVEIMEIV